MNPIRPRTSQDATPPPTREQLVSRVARLVAAATVVVVAAFLVRTGGWPEHQWQYVAIAASLLPEALRDGLAAADTDRRARLRTHRSFSPVPLLATLALLGVAFWAWTGEQTTPVIAALIAAGGMAIAAAPLRVTLVPAR